MTVTYDEAQSGYWTIETPFNEQDEWDYEDQLYYEEPIVIDMPNSIYGYDDPVQQRMMIVLATVVLGVLLFGGLALPRIRAASTSLTTAATNTDLTAAVIDVDVPTAANVGNANEFVAATYTGELSPLFTAEVQHWAPQIMKWAEAYNLDPNIVATIMQIESCGDPNAESIAGAQGLFQVMPLHFTAGENMQDPDTNARRGLDFYVAQMEYTGGDILLSFAGYNGGYAASGSPFATWPNETQRYYTWAKGIYADASAGNTTSETLDQWLAAGGGGGCQRAASRLGMQ